MSRPTRAEPVPLDYATPRRKPFWRRVTLVEALLLPLGLLALAISIALPKLVYLDRSPRAACASHLRSLGQSLYMYAQDHGGHLPDGLERSLIDTYGADASLFRCPASAPDGPAYAYVGMGRTTADPPGTVLMFEFPTVHPGGKIPSANVLYLDGHVENVAADHAYHLIAELAAGRNPPRPLALPLPVE